MESNRFTQLLLGIVAVLLLLPYLGQDATPKAWAQDAAGGQQMFAVSAPGVSAGNNVLFVIDPLTQRLVVYEHRAGGALILHSVRNMGPEMQFQQYPGGKQGKKIHQPTVKQILDMLKE